MSQDLCHCGKYKHVKMDRCGVCICNNAYPESSSQFSSTVCKSCSRLTNSENEEYCLSCVGFLSALEKSTRLNSHEDLDKILAEELETAAKPTRYNQPGTTLEYWDAVDKLGWNYFQGAAGKYIHRYKDKNGPEDLVKAINYCIKMISQQTNIDYYELHKLTPEELAKRVKK